MKYLGTFLLFLIIGFGLTFLLIAKKTTPDVAHEKEIKIPEASQFSIETAPSQSLHGDITSISGTVKWQSRIATESSIITSPQKIQQAEIIETGENGKVSIAFPALLLSLENDSRLEIVQSLPEHIVLDQKNGTIEYQNNSSLPLEVRISPLLVQLKKSIIRMTRDEENDTVIVNAVKGTAKIGYNDSDNLSTIENLTEGERMIFDLTTRTSAIK